MEDIFVRRVYRHKGVTIIVAIDLLKGKISLEEYNGNGGYQNKKFVFADRTQEYLGGWLLILEAMKKAITEANVTLEERSKRKTENLVKALVDMSKLKAGK